MRLVKISEYNHFKMQLAKPVYDRKHRILLAAGNTIHPKYLKKLKEIGMALDFSGKIYTTLYIQET